MTAEEVIEMCHWQNIFLLPKDGERLKIYGPPEMVTDELLAMLKKHKAKIIDILQERVLCPYKGKLRYIHPEVCKWHMEEDDPECEECDPDNVKVLH